MADRRKKNLASVAITLLIIAMLILSQPVASLLVAIENLPGESFVGKPIKFTARITIQSGEWVNIKEIRLNVTKDGKVDSISIPVKLTPGATVISNEDLPNTNSTLINVTVNETTNAVFGYGYGYGYISSYGYGYLGWGYGYGYGYRYGYYPGYGYGYYAIGAPPAYIAYDIEWKPNETGKYSFELTVIVEDRSGNEVSFSTSADITISKPLVYVKPSSKTINVGDTATFDIILNKTLYGLSGYNITVKLSNPSAAEITSISLPSWAKLEEHTSLPASAVIVKVTELDDLINGTVENLKLFSITLKGKSAGTTDIIVQINQMDDDDGDPIHANVQKAVLTVKSVAPAPRPVGGGGGGAVIVAPPPGVIATYSEVRTVPANTPVKITLPVEKAEETGIVAITIKLPERMTIQVRVSKLVTLPSGVPAPAVAAVFAYLDISFIDYSTGEEVEPAGYIEFKVPKSWIAENGYDPSNVVLMKYHNGWKELKTEMTGEDENYYYYKAETGSFSIFAIAVKAAAVPTTVTTPVVTITPTVTTPVVVTTTPTPAPGVSAELIAGIVIAVVIVAAIIAYALRRRKS